MKRYLLIMTTILLAKVAANATSAPNYAPPVNGKIQTAILAGSYSCDDAGPFKALNLNGETYQNGNYYPDLQMNFACGSPADIEGTDNSLIADLGNVRLEDINTYLAQTPVWQVGKSYNFRLSAPIKENNTYTVMLNTFKYRGILVFRVISYRENILTIQYATREYSLINEIAKSQAIDQDQNNSN